MNILIIAAYLPGPTGGANTRAYYLLEALASKHMISLLAYVDHNAQADKEVVSRLEQLTSALKIVTYTPRPAWLKRYSQLFSTLRGRSYILQNHMNKELQDILDTWFKDSSFDIILFEGVFMAGYHVPASLPVVIDEHNLEYEILERTARQEKGWLRRWYNQREYQILKPIELERCERASAVVIPSEREQQILQQHLPQQRITTVPNGVDTVLFTNEGRQEVPGRIVFIGTMNYYPNMNAVLGFAQDSWPRIQQAIPTASWQIVGREPPLEVRKLAHLPGVEVTGTVADVRPYFAQAEVVVVPLQIGSGTRLKILEALAMEKAIVSTSIGCEGINVVSGKHLLIADGSETFAEAVIELLKDPQRRRLLGRAGRELVEEHYSWRECGRRLLHVLEDLKEREHIC